MKMSSCHRRHSASRFPDPVVTEQYPPNVDDSAGQRHQSVGVRAVLGPLELVEGPRRSAASCVLAIFTDQHTAPVSSTAHA